MRSWKLYTAAMLLLAGCSGNNDRSVAEATEYALSLERAGLTILVRAGEDDMPLSQGTEMGLYAIDTPGGAFNTGGRTRNVSYRVTAPDGTISSSRPAMLEKAHSYAIYAYAPRRTADLAEVDDDAVVTVRHGEDILYASPASLSLVSEDNHSATLRFSHRMAQVQFFLTTDSELNADYLAGAVFEIGGFYETADLSLRNATLSTQPDSEATIASEPGELQSNPVCIIPGEGIQTLTVKLTTPKNGTQTKTHNFTFEAGRSYRIIVRYTVALDLEIESSVIAWNEMNGGDINIGGGI